MVKLHKKHVRAFQFILIRDITISAVTSNFCAFWAIFRNSKPAADFSGLNTNKIGLLSVDSMINLLFIKRKSKSTQYVLKCTTGFAQND